MQPEVVQPEPVKPEVAKPNPIEKSLMIGIVCLVTYVIFRILPTDVIFVSGVITTLFVVIARLKWMKLREKGLVNLLSPKLRNLLLHKSIFDVYCDIIYFPIVSEIIKAFVVPLITKPTPDKIFGSFSELPPKVRNAIATKGILHLAPERVQNLMLKENWTVAHEQYGKVDPTWYNQRYYEKVSATKPPKRTLKHQLSDKVMRFRWHYLLAASLVMMLVAKKYSKVQIWQLLIKRGFELGVVMFAISLVFSIKQFMHHQKSQVDSTHSLTHRTHSEEHMTRGALITLKKAISQASEAGAV